MARIQYHDEISDLLMKAFPAVDPAYVSKLATPIAGRAVSSKPAEHNVSRSKGKAATLVEIETMQKRAILLIESLDGDKIGTEAHQMIHKHLQWQADIDGILPIMKTIAALINASTAAHDTISQWPENSALKSKSKPKKFASRGVAVSLARAYEKLSGTKATIPTNDGRAYGPFLELLTEVFAITGIDASPEAAGRAAIKSLKEKRSKIIE